MAKFDAAQAVDVLAINQLINEWAAELDVGNGVNLAPLLTDDCAYTVRAETRPGSAAVVAFYKQRLVDMGATPAGVPLHRHALSNLRVNFTGADTATIGFGLIYFTAVVKTMGADLADPFSFADVSMDCRRESDGHWRISRFDSEPVIIRTPK